MRHREEGRVPELVTLPQLSTSHMPVIFTSPPASSPEVLAANPAHAPLSFAESPHETFSNFLIVSLSPNPLHHIVDKNIHRFRFDPLLPAIPLPKQPYPPSPMNSALLQKHESSHILLLLKTPQWCLRTRRMNVIIFESRM